MVGRFGPMIPAEVGTIVVWAHVSAAGLGVRLHVAGAGGGGPGRPGPGRKGANDVVTISCVATLPVELTTTVNAAPAWSATVVVVNCAGRPRRAAAAPAGSRTPR